MLSPEYMRTIMQGSKDLDIDELRKATVYQGYSPKQKYIRDFWRLVSSWREEKQKRLVKFVTAAERIPAGGASQLTFRIEKDGREDLESLPTSSTCFGTLVLPQYPNVETLDRKLTVALELGLEGFGTV
jgi:hypothetical protein